MEKKFPGTLSLILMMHRWEKLRTSVWFTEHTSGQIHTNCNLNSLTLIISPCWVHLPTFFNCFLSNRCSFALIDTKLNFAKVVKLTNSSLSLFNCRIYRLMYVLWFGLDFINSFTKLRGLGLPNWILNDLDSKPSKFEWRFWSNSKFDYKNHITWNRIVVFSIKIDLFLMTFDLISIKRSKKDWKGWFKNNTSK